MNRTDMPPLRVTVVQQGGVLGGAERWQLQLAGATDRLELSAIALGTGPTAAEWGRRGWPVTVLPNERTPRRLPLLAARVTAALRRTRPDVVVAHGVKAALVAAPAARVLGIPVVWVRHDASFSGRLVRIVDRATDGQVSSGEWLTRGRAPGNGLVLQPPRMGPPLPRDEARARLGLRPDEGELLLGMATRIVRNKGIEDAVRALAEPTTGAWVLAVAGLDDPSEPEERERLVKLAAELGVAERVRFLGAVPDFHRVVSAFDAVAVLTRPSPDLPWYREAFGMTALEAITGGVPVLATPPVEQVAGAGGLAVGADRPDEVALALNLLADPGTRRRIGDAGRLRAADYPDAAEAAGRLVDHLALVAGRPGAGHAATGPAISVVTTVLDDEDGLTDLLTGLVPQLGPDDELVVVDGGSVDGTVPVALRAAEADRRVQVFAETGAGISRGRNLGIGIARHDAIVCTDAGCIPARGWLAALRASFDRHPDVDLWTGTYRVLAERPWELALAAVGYPSIEELGRRSPFVRAYGRFLGRTFDATMPTGRSVGFTRQAWRAAGGFPEHLATGEDVLFGRRIVETGGAAVLVRDAEVVWAQRPTLRANLRMLRRYGEGSGYSLDRRLMGRDLARVAAYAVGAAALARGGRRSRAATAGATALYLSVPVSRALRGPRPVATAALVPAIAAARDLVKAFGAVSAASRRLGGTR